MSALGELELNPALLDEVGRDICIRCRTYPILSTHDGLVFAAQNVNDELLREALQLRSGKDVEFRKADGPLAARPAPWKRAASFPI
jgi:hypothetical protein